MEKATEQVRVFPSDYKKLKDEADKRRTIMAQVLHEKLDK